MAALRNNSYTAQEKCSASRWSEINIYGGALCPDRTIYVPHLRTDNQSLLWTGKMLHAGVGYNGARVDCQRNDQWLCAAFEKLSFLLTRKTAGLKSVKNICKTGWHGLFYS